MIETEKTEQRRKRKMNHEEIRKILEKTDCVRFSGSAEEKEAAAYQRYRDSISAPAKK